MKTKQEIISDYLAGAQETIIKLDLNEQYLQARYAQENNKRQLEELAKIAADKKETQNWIEFLSRQLEAGK